MSRDEWFRSPRWDAEEREQFEAKLARARPTNRPQYLRLKGLALLEGDRQARLAARELFGRAIDSGDRLQAAMAQADLARSFEQAGHARAAADAYRACLQAEDALQGSLRTGAELNLVDLIVREHWEADYGEALGLLERSQSVGLTFEVERWRHAVARARLHARRCDQDKARAAAQQALRLAEQSRPDFSRHPEVGRIKAERRTLAEMKKLAK